MNNGYLNSSHNRYTTNYISGETNFDFNNINHFENQNDVLDKKKLPKTYNLPFEKMYTSSAGINKQRFTPDYKNLENRNNDNFDPLGEYLYKRGDREFSSITRYTSHYITIDSRFRQKEPIYDKLEYIQLPVNPLQFNKMKKNTLIIKTNNLLKLEVNDKISLSGLANIYKILKINNNFFTYTNGSEYIKVNYPHGLYFNNLEEAKNYKSSDLFIELSLLDFSEFSNETGNISINSIFTIQRVHLFNDSDYSNDYFFIKLPKKFNGSYVHNADYSLKLTYLYYFGIPTNNINSQYPINFQNKQGYLIVDKVNDKTIEIKINKNFNIEDTNVIFGGSNICIAKINVIQKGYPMPTEYTLPLDRIYNNIISIKMISSEFPKLNKLVYGCTDILEKNDNNIITNNKLYWQNLDDNDTIYEISLEQGNYSFEDLIKSIEYKVSKINRIPIINSSYNTKNIIKIDYFKDSNEFKFKSFKEADVPECIDISNCIISNTNTVLRITLNNHGLLINDKITIFNAIDTDKILKEDINKEHYVSNIIDNNNFEIILHNINLLGNINTTKGGFNIKIIVENYFRLRFDKNDTLGEFFGFRKLGDVKSITEFKKIISNRDLYLNENIDDKLLCIDENNCKVLKSIDLQNENYIMMTCNSLNLENNLINQMITYSKIKNIFSKIQIKNELNILDNVVYNSYIQAPMYFHNPIHELKELSFNFYDKFGNKLYYADFEHSFTLEIITIGEIPEKTNFSAKYPKIN